MISLYRLVDWILVLPPALEAAFEQALEAIEKEHNVAYVTSIERRADEAGLADWTCRILVAGTLEDVLGAVELGAADHSSSS